MQKEYLVSEQEHLSIQRFQVIDLNGNSVSTGGKDANLSDRDYFKNALKGEVTISDPVLSRITDTVVLVCAAPIYAENGTIAGVLSATINPEVFTTIIDRQVGLTGYGFILNDRGMFIAHPDKDLVYSMRTYIDEIGMDSELSRLGEIQREMVRGETGFDTYTFKGVRKCIAYAPIPDSNWSLALAVPFNEMFSAGGILIQNFILVTLTAIAAAILACFLIFKVMLHRQKIQELQENIREKSQQLNESAAMDRMRTQFFTNISHEFRTPVNVILGAVQLFEMYTARESGLENRENIQKHVRSMRQNCRRLMRMINNLIDVSRLDAGYLETRMGNHNIVSIVEDITLSIDGYTKAKGITLEFDTEVEERLLACDPDKIERIMLNLLSNAIKYTGPGGCIWVKITDTANAVRISVKDTGTGIRKEHQEIIFERFRQVNESLTREQEGSGIGLSLVKSLVELHQGKIEVYSEYGSGSEFIIELPAKTLPGEQTVPVPVHYGSNQERVEVEFSDIYVK